MIDCCDTLDVATFSITDDQIAESKSFSPDCRGAWPPDDVKQGAPLSLAGYPEHMRVPTTPGHMDFVAIGSFTVADDVTDRHILTTYDPTRDFAPRWAPDGLPPLGFNMSGASSGPVIMHETVNGIHRFVPVALIVQGPSGRAQDPAEKQRCALGDMAQFDRIKMRRLNCVAEDGTLIKETGWLP